MRVIFLAFLVSSFSYCLAAGEWKVLDAERTIDLTTQVRIAIETYCRVQIVKTSAVVTYENVAAKEQNTVLFAVPTDENEHLSYFVVREDSQKGKLKFTKQNSEKGFQVLISVHI